MVLPAMRRRLLTRFSCTFLSTCLLAANIQAQEPPQAPPTAAMPPVVSPTAPTESTTPPTLDPSLLAGLRFRNIGPAGMSGRIGAVAGVPGDPTIVWVGAASGGVWKSTDGGVRFTPVFDDQDCASIGAIAIDPRSPDVVWVGSGEGNPRNSASVGRGLYRTRDGGRSWQKLGLEQTEHIHRVLLHPTDPRVVFVGALGKTWGENEERGVFRSRDGGQTFDKVLYVDAATGCADLAMDPRNPDKLFAAMWHHRRWPWAFQSGGPGSGLHRSLDGGTTWTRLGEPDGLPGGELGRISVVIAPSDPRIVYALIESKRSALYRSDDGGFRWQRVNDSPGVAPRPFYFCDLRVDPQDPNRVYNLHVVVDVSTDGGRTFQELIGWDAAHPDHHSMWIDPLDARRVLLGNDGGVYQSLDRGAAWRFCANLPLAQFYHIAVDNDLPYHVYGGLQDNGSFRGPSTVWENGGIRNFHWREVCFGDGFAVLPDPRDSQQGYAMSQGGALIRWDLRTGQQKSIRPPAPEGTELRFHWNAAIAQDPFEPATIYYGSQFVHRSPDRGESWAVISPDLTTDNPEWQRQEQSGGLSLDVTGAENHCTILSIAPSPVQRDVLWVSTDDGRVQVTQDGGRSWTSVEGNIPGLPRHTWCPHVEASKHDVATAFAVFDGHRCSDWTPYVYRTTDFGKTWTSLRTDAIDGYCLVLEQDPVQPDLLFLGTEFGLYVTFDGGQQWHRFTHGFPTCSAMAITVHPKYGDLIVATHGRAVFVLDDMTPLRTWSAELQQRRLHVFQPQDAIAWITAQSPGSRFPGQGEFRGETKRRGALLHVQVSADDLAHPDPKRAPAVKPKDKPADAKETPTAAAATTEQPGQDAQPKPKDTTPNDHVTVEIHDATGLLVRTFRSPVKLGLNRIVWSLERDGQPYPTRSLEVDPPELPPPGRQVLPGDYTATVRFRGEQQQVPVRVLADPRVDVPLADRQGKDAAWQRHDALQQRLREATQRLLRCRADVDLVQQRLKLEPKAKGDAVDPLQAVRDAWQEVDKALADVEQQLWGPKERPQGITRSTGLMAEAQEQLRKLTGTPEAPNPTELQALERAAAKTDLVAAAVDAFVTGAMATFRQRLETGEFGLLPKAGPTDKR